MPASNLPAVISAENPPVLTVPAVPTAIAKSPARQLSELDLEELEVLAGELGMETARYPSRQHLVAAIHERRQMIANLNRDAMVDVVRWAKKPVPPNAGREKLALVIAGIRSMRFAGLSQRGLVVLTRLRGLEASDADVIPELVKKLKKQEGLFSRINRKRRAMIGSLVSNMLGEEDRTSTVTFDSPQPGGTKETTADRAAAVQSGSTKPFAREASIKEEIEDAGLIGGLANRVKKTADSYINQKLDEIESRIDRKLDEIDRRLAEWRDKEIANRIRILKITLWVSVIVGIFSLIYSYVQVYFPRH